MFLSGIAPLLAFIAVTGPLVATAPPHIVRELPETVKNEMAAVGLAHAAHFDQMDIKLGLYTAGKTPKLMGLLLARWLRDQKLYEIVAFTVALMENYTQLRNAAADLLKKAMEKQQLVSNLLGGEGDAENQRRYPSFLAPFAYTKNEITSAQHFQPHVRLLIVLGMYPVAVMGKDKKLNNIEDAGKLIANAIGVLMPC